ncbi:MAG TPA: hypothetical protein VJA18_01595 [Candidatus Nanoarchaeia archaeon]|nr:hypothetical protein [Candidatus Nanoarchaeia archaeon]
MLKEIAIILLTVLLAGSVGINIYVLTHIDQFGLERVYDFNSNNIPDEIEEEIVNEISLGKLTLDQDELNSLKEKYRNKNIKLFEDCGGKDSPNVIRCMVFELSELKKK